jgi:hypothetical protein
MPRIAYRDINFRPATLKTVRSNYIDIIKFLDERGLLPEPEIEES